MAYFAPYIDETGLHLPTYSDIRDDLIEQAKTIFGQDIYLENDSLDYQMISAYAAKDYDCMLLLQSVYSSKGPNTALGTSLDSLVKLNGISRKGSSYSTCSVILTGIAGTVIANGIVADVNLNSWNLPESVTIGEDGTVTVIATSEIAGEILAGVGDITTIVTPTYGWTAVTNSVVATSGVSVETDSVLRARQAISAARPSLTVLEGTKGSIAEVLGVTRFVVYENDTGAADSNGLPAHSLTAVVEGGADADIAQAIYNKKGVGCYTNGTTSVQVTDAYGYVNTIRFYRPSYVDIDVAISVKGLSGYTSQTTLDIKNALVSYLNSLEIGDDLAISSLWGASLATISDLSKPTFSITSVTAAKHGQVKGTSDIVIAFNEVTRGNVANITVTVT